jgi:hypothetical protein
MSSVEALIENQKNTVKVILQSLKGKIKPNHRVIKILAPTGFGKTSLIPMTIVSNIIPDDRMLVLFPNTAAVFKMYQYLKQFESLSSGMLKVGYAAASDINYTSEHNLVLATYGHGYRLALGSISAYSRRTSTGGKAVHSQDFGLLQFNSIVFDEYHHTSKEVPLVASIYRELLETLDDKSPAKRASLSQHRAFFMTATDIHELPGGMGVFEGDRLLKIELGTDSESGYTVRYRPPHNIKIDPDTVIPSRLDTRRFSKKTKILVNILDEVCNTIEEVLNISSPSVKSEVKNSLFDISRITINEPKKKKTQATQSLPTEHNGVKIRYHNILVFLPGKREIQYVEDKIRSNDRPNVEVFAFHSKSPSNTIKELNLPPAEGMRRIILATNIVESSVTIDYLDVVIDSLLEKTIIYNEELAAKQLVLQYISQNSSKQRAGRVGRNRVGVAIKMIAESDYNKLMESKPNSIITEDSSKVVIECLHFCGQNLYANVLNKAGVDTPSIKKGFSEAIKWKVFALERVDGKSKFKQIVDNEAFKLISRLPLDLKTSMFLIRWLEAKYEYPPYPGIVMAALWDMNTQLFDYFEDQAKIEVFINRHNLNHHTQIGTSINAWLYAVRSIRSISMSEAEIRGIFHYDKSIVVDESQFKRLSSIIYECVRATTDYLRQKIKPQIDSTRDNVKSMKTASDTNTDSLNRQLDRLKELNDQFKKPVVIGEFKVDAAIRGLGYVAQELMGINEIGHIVENKNTVTIVANDVSYSVTKSLADTLKLNPDDLYLILNKFVVDNRKMATNIIPTYSTMDSAMKKSIVKRKPNLGDDNDDDDNTTKKKPSKTKKKASGRLIRKSDDESSEEKKYSKPKRIEPSEESEDELSNQESEVDDDEVDDDEVDDDDDEVDDDEVDDDEVDDDEVDDDEVEDQSEEESNHEGSEVEDQSEEESNHEGSEVEDQSEEVSEI